MNEPRTSIIWERLGLGFVISGIGLAAIQWLGWIPSSISYGLAITGCLVVLSGFIAWWGGRIINSQLQRSLRPGKELRFEVGDKVRTQTDAIEQKKQSYLNIPSIAFHYADKQQIDNFYNDYFKEPTIEKVVNEIVSEMSGEISATLPKILESKAGGKNLSKWISDIKLPDSSLSEKFRRWQREAINNDQVTLGLELVDIDLSDLQALDRAVLELSSKFLLSLPEADVQKSRSELQKRAAEKTLIRLEQARGWVLIEGKFRITEGANGFYSCVYKHPVTDYLGDGAKEITISITLRKDSLEPSIAGNYAQSIGRAIPLTIYGRVWSPVDRQSGAHELQITPIAVY